MCDDGLLQSLNKLKHDADFDVALLAQSASTAIACRTIQDLHISGSNPSNNKQQKAPVEWKPGAFRVLRLLLLNHNSGAGGENTTHSHFDLKGSSIEESVNDHKNHNKEDFPAKMMVYDASLAALNQFIDFMTMPGGHAMSNSEVELVSEVVFIALDPWINPKPEDQSVHVEATVKADTTLNRYIREKTKDQFSYFVGKMFPKANVSDGTPPTQPPSKSPYLNTDTSKLLKDVCKWLDISLHDDNMYNPAPKSTSS
ncbi:unnamed protein product [Somion occarium]|uniref:Uncharacterized protein n=1 Tax=Somion occarium TaxID=3059160 RepID=A0ABP1EBZ0_9APHY